MAWVTSFERKSGSGKLQPTQLVGQVKVFNTHGDQRIVQIDTFGSADRALPNKQSQTLQLGRDSAFQLFQILRDTYDF